MPALLARRLLLGRLAVIAALLPVGIASKWYTGPAERYVIGQVWDACGSAVVLLTARLLVPRARPWRNALAVGAMLWCNELLQLAHAPWLEELRATLLGRVVLGSGFNPLDLVVIAGAVAAAAALDARAGRSVSFEP